MFGIKTKSELISALHDSNQRVANWFTEIPATDFFTRHADVWSASDNIDHLVKSHKPLAKALKLPKITLQVMFGTPQKASTSYEELCQIYRDEIAKGAQASGRYLPDQENPDANTEKKKKELIDQFSKVSADLVSAVGKWAEDELPLVSLTNKLLNAVSRLNSKVKV